MITSKSDGYTTCQRLANPTAKSFLDEIGKEGNSRLAVMRRISSWTKVTPRALIALLLIYSIPGGAQSPWGAKAVEEHTTAVTASSMVADCLELRVDDEDYCGDFETGSSGPWPPIPPAVSEAPVLTGEAPQSHGGVPQQNPSIDVRRPNVGSGGGSAER